MTDVVALVALALLAPVIRPYKQGVLARPGRVAGPLGAALTFAERPARRAER